MNNPIEAYLRDRVELGRDLLAEHEPRKGADNLVRHWAELAERFGEHGLARIHDRSCALMRQLFGNSAAPPPANYQSDGYAAVEADLVAEQLLAEYQRAGVRPSEDPEWRAKLNTRNAALLDRYLERIEQRAHPPAPAPGPEPPKLEELVTRAVAIALDARLPAREDEDPPLRWRGVWSEGWTYRHGDAATHNGVLWFAKRATDARPGEGDSGWQLMHKAIVREMRPQKSEREAARTSA